MAVNPMVAQFLQALATQQMQAPPPGAPQYAAQGGPLMAPMPAGGEFSQLPMNPQLQSPGSAPGEAHQLPIQQHVPSFSAMSPGAGQMRPPEAVQGGNDPGFLVGDIMKRLAGQHQGPRQPRQMPLQGAAGY